jgi:hypothetical protein
MGYSLICLRSPGPTNPPSETSTQLLLGREVMAHLAAFCWQWGDGEIGESVLVSGVDQVVSMGPWKNGMDGTCLGRGKYSLTKSWSLILWTCWDINLQRSFIIQDPKRDISRSIKKCLVRDAYLGIQILQNPVTPKKALSCFMVWGRGKQRIGDSLPTQGVSLSL